MNVLALVAHADDELLGPGGTLIRHARTGDDVHVAIFVGKPNLAMYASARYGQEVLDKRRTQAEKAAKVAGFKSVHWLGLIDETLEQDLNSTVTAAEKVVKKVVPKVVYMHHGGDLNQDHRGVFKAGLIAVRGLLNPRVDRVLTFETPSTTEQAPALPGWQFQPNHFVNVAATLERKIRALRMYDDELRPFPHPRSREGLIALARVRGSAVGMRAAEAFSVVRECVG
ncbi:MAG: PIG-L family deacetylase [Elusimicrobiota bacterium]